MRHVQKSRVLDHIYFIHVSMNYNTIHIPNTQLSMFSSACADLEGGRGSGSPLKYHKNIVFFSNTGSDPLKNHKATCTKPAFNVGPSSARQRNAIFKRRFADGPMMACFYCYLGPLSHHQKNG